MNKLQLSALGLASDRKGFEIRLSHVRSIDQELNLISATHRPDLYAGKVLKRRSNS